jgi:hypothetical protein
MLNRVVKDPFFPLVMLWIPGSGPLAILVAWYVDRDMDQLFCEVDKLEKLKYNWKDI